MPFLLSLSHHFATRGRHVHGFSATFNLARLARLGLVFVRKDCFLEIEAGEKFDGPCFEIFWAWRVGGLVCVVGWS